jgi:hypothetical protein
MTLAEMYRTHAAECVALAQKARTTEDRARLLQMAQAWRELAERHEVDSLRNTPRASGT